MGRALVEDDKVSEVVAGDLGEVVVGVWMMTGDRVGETLRSGSHVGHRILSNMAPIPLCTHTHARTHNEIATGPPEGA